MASRNAPRDAAIESAAPLSAEPNNSPPESQTENGIRRPSFAIRLARRRPVVFDFRDGNWKLPGSGVRIVNVGRLMEWMFLRGPGRSWWPPISGEMRCSAVFGGHQAVAIACVHWGSVNPTWKCVGSNFGGTWIRDFVSDRSHGPPVDAVLAVVSGPWSVRGFAACLAGRCSRCG